MKEQIERALVKLGVTRAGTDSDSRRWSVSDLATDLAAELAKERSINWAESSKLQPTFFLSDDGTVCESTGWQKCAACNCWSEPGMSACYSCHAGFDWLAKEMQAIKDSGYKPVSLDMEKQAVEDLTRVPPAALNPFHAKHGQSWRDEG